MVWNTDHNVVIFGASQNGKSTIANEKHRQSSRIGVFFNHDDEPFVTGHPATSIQDLQTLFAHGKDKIDYQLPMFAQNVEEQLEQLVKYLMLLGENKGGKFLLTIDEAHEIAYEGSMNTPIHLAVKRGIKRGLRVQVITQDPAQLSNAVVRQTKRIVWVGPMSNKTKEYFLGMKGFPDTGAEKLANTPKYQYTCINHDGDVISRGPTK